MLLLKEKMQQMNFREGNFSLHRWWIVNNTFFQYYSLLIFLVCVIVMIGVSYATEEPNYAKISGLTYATMTDRDRDESRASWTARDVVASGLVLALIVAAYLYFTG